MRRSIALALLALLIGLSVGAPVSAAEPSASGPVPSVAPEPSSDPSTDPSSEPPVEPSTAPVPPDPTAAPSVEPSVPAATPEAPADTPAPVATDPAPVTDLAGRPDTTGRYIVMLKSSADPNAVVAKHAARDRIKADRSFTKAFRGFTSRLTGAQRTALLADANVLAVVPDEVIELTAQTLPTGVARVGGMLNPVAAIDGTDARVNADVAIVDTGIATHPDLNVAGGYNCSTSDRSAWRDVEGHGTHVAGTVAALDNGIGVVGVAPGARVWAVKILNDDGYGLLSWYVCGLDWILAQRDPSDSSRPLFEAVNMSVTKDGRDDNACGASNADPLHAAICRVVAGGITVVAAAANDSGAASFRVPASYNEVITVSALADTDGKAGSLGGNKCYSWGGYDQDDTFADFSNYGADVDLIAPGKCIWSTRPGSSYGYSSGTSMSAPTVTGAVALYKASRPNATPAEVKEALQYLGNLGWKWSTDPDAYHEKLLDVSRIGSLGSFNLGLGPVDLTREGAAVIAAPITVTRSASFFERVKLSVTGVPSGWTATLSATSLIGWTATAATLTVNVPAGVAEGRYDLRVTGTNQGRTDYINVPVTVAVDAPTAAAPVGYVTYGVKLGSTVPVRVAWPAATDPSSAIAGYEVQTSINGGAYGYTVSTSGSVHEVLRSVGLNGASYRFRVRARDSAGNWSAWATAANPTRVYVVDDRSSTLTYNGSWARVAYAYAANGTLTRSSQTGAGVRLTFTGRGVAIVAPRNAYRGSIDVYLDGVFVKTVLLKTSTSVTRQVVIARAWTSVGTHTIQLKVRGGNTYPLVEFDAFLVDK